MKEILEHILNNFYDITKASDTEKDLFKNLDNFKDLLTSPWKRIIKD